MLTVRGDQTHYTDELLYENTYDPVSATLKRMVWHLETGSPAMARESIADDWKTTIPELVPDPVALETVRTCLDTDPVETLAPALDE